MFDERAAATRAAHELKARGVDGPVRAPDWDREPRTPRVRLGAGSCDTHVHVVGPQEVFPLQRSPFHFVEYEDSTVEDWLRVAGVLGLDRAVHVASFTYGYGYHVMLHTLMKAPDALRGVVVLWPGITDGELDILEAAGVVGARFTPSLHPRIDEGLVRRLTERGWSLHYAVETSTTDDWRRAILARPGRFVLEHIGMCPPAEGTRSPQFRFVLECLDTGRAWVKLSTRLSDDLTLPFADVAPLVTTVLERAPDRALWGSDWPHVPYFRPMPNDADLLDLAGDWMTDAALLAKVFVDNPAEVFDWPL